MGMSIDQQREVEDAHYYAIQDRDYIIQGPPPPTQRVKRTRTLDCTDDEWMVVLDVLAASRAPVKAT